MILILSPMQTAKIIRHRHKYHHYMNDDLKSVTEDTHFKIVFSDPKEFDLFREWIVKHDGEYKYNKEESKQEGTFPKVPMFHDEICWCDIMTYYLLHVAGFSFDSTISPYKGEVYVKDRDWKSGERGMVTGGTGNGGMVKG